ncbi:MAG: hypothetical protein AAF742_04770 [Pseudomonadota bacterium]
MRGDGIEDTVEHAHRDNRDTLMGWICAVFVLSGAVCQAVFAFRPDLFGITETIGGQSNANNTPIIPEGFAVAIWGPLFLGSLALGIFSFFPSARRNDLTRSVLWLAGAAYWGNAIWALYTPVRGPGWGSFILLELILAPLLAAIVLIRRHNPYGTLNNLAYAPVFALAGWLTIASAAGISTAAKFAGFNPMGLTELPASFLVISLWTLAATGLVWYAKSFVYVVPIAWGLYGIYFANAGDGYPSLGKTAAGLAAFLIVVSVVSKIVGTKNSTVIK